MPVVAVTNAVIVADVAVAVAINVTVTVNVTIAVVVVVVVPVAPSSLLLLLLLPSSLLRTWAPTYGGPTTRPVTGATWRRKK